MTTRNPILATTSKTSDTVKAETTMISHLPAVLGKVSVPINGVMMTAAQIVTQIQSHLDAVTALDNFRAQAKAALALERARQATVKATVLCVRSYVTIAFGEQSTQYALLGFSARKPAQKSAASKATAVTKTLATRAARHTMGKNQKADIHGVDPESASASAPSVTAVTGSAAGATGSTSASSTPQNGASVTNGTSGSGH
jgi:hypothetical protein